MTDTIRQRILEAAIAALNADRPADVPEANEKVSFPGEAVREPRMAVLLLEELEQPPRHAHDLLSQNSLQLGVQCVGVVEDAQDLNKSTEPMLGWAQKVLGKGNLGGLAVQTFRTGVTWERESLDVYIQKALAAYTVVYPSRRDDPYQPR